MPGLPALSVAVTVIILSPFLILMSLHVHSPDVSVASPVPLFPVRALDQAILFIPEVVSEACTVRLIFFDMVVGVVIVTVGAVVSRVIETLAEDDTLSNSSLNQT